MTLHYAPTTPEEEELALALALSASLSSAPCERARGSSSKPSESPRDSDCDTMSDQLSGRGPRPPCGLASKLSLSLNPSLIYPQLPLPPAARLPTASTTSRPPVPSPSTSSSALRPTLPTTSSHLNANHRHSASASPARTRLPPGHSAPVSPKAAAGAPPAFSRNSDFQSAGSPRAAAPSPLRPSRPPHPQAAFQPPLSPPPQLQQPPSLFPRKPPAPVQPTAIPRSRSATGPVAMLGAGGAAAIAAGSSSRSIGAAGASGSSSRSIGGAGGCGSSRSTGSGGAGPSTAPAPPMPPQVAALRPQQQQQQQQQQPGSPVLYSDPDACAGCGKGFGLFNRTWITGMGRKWHATCFRCGFCREALSDGRSAFSYQMHPSDPRPYHPDCYRHVHHPLCHVCGSYIAASAEGVISFRENGFWRERYCTTHSEEELKRCCACSRLQKLGEEWAPLPDDRPLCLHCLSSVVLDTPDAQPIYDEVLAFYRNEMKLTHPYKPPLLLVDGATLNSHAQAEGRDDSAGAPVFHVRGLCVATMYSHIPTILRGMGGTIRSVATELLSPTSPSSSRSGSGGGASGVHCHVKVLLLLYGLPRLLSGSIMAHELMHAWLRMEGVVGLPLKVEEGLCQLMACLWLDRQHELLKGNPDEQRLASFFSYQIRTDTSDVYGGGFREAMEAFQAIGLTAMLRNVKKHGRFT